MENVELRLGAPPNSPVLQAYMNCRAPVSICRGPLGSGKTTGTVQRCMLQMIQKPAREFGPRLERRSFGMAVRNTYGDLRDTTIKDFLLLFVDGEYGRMKWDDPPVYEVRMPLSDGTHVVADVVFRALDRPAHAQKTKGYQLDWVWLNETSELNKAIVDMLDLRHGRYKAELGSFAEPEDSWHGMFGDTNSYDSTHWLAKLERNPPPGWSFFVQPGGVIQDDEGNWSPNPKAENLTNLRRDYYARGMSGKDESWIKVMLGNQIGFTVRGRPVHPRFNPDVHVSKRPLAFDARYPLLIGMDYGRTPAAVLFQFIEVAGRYHVLAELTSEDMSASIFAPELKRMIDRRWCGVPASGWGDPAGDARSQATEDTPILICRAAGLPIQPAPSNIWALRKAAVDNVLLRLGMDTRPALQVDPSCQFLIKALMGGYHYRELQVSGPEARYSDEPEKNDSSHIAEALQYGLLGAGEGRAALRPADANLMHGREHLPRFAESTW